MNDSPLSVERRPLWLQGRDSRQGSHPGERLIQQVAAAVADQGIVRIPGAHDALSAIMAERAGFHALYLSGAAVTAAMGLPDLGVLTMEELVASTRRICRATDLPLVVDGDTGFGEALNCMRLVQELETAGAAAVQLEDQILPKKCGHLNDKRLLGIDDACRKIAAAKQASRGLKIIARTDAAAVGFDEAVTRAQAYVDAGADIIFPEALGGDNEFKRMADAVRVPMLANMTEFGRTPYRSADAFAALGYRLIIWPVSSLRIAAKAVETFYTTLYESGETHSQLDKMLTRESLYELIRYTDFEDLDSAIVRSVLPQIDTKEK